MTLEHFHSSGKIPVVRMIENTTNTRGNKVSTLTKKSSGDLVKAVCF